MLAGRVRMAASVGLVTVVAYLGWLGWDQAKDVHPDGSVTGPYTSWQVAGLVLVLAAVAVATGWRRRPWLAASVTTVVMTVCWSVDAATDPPEFNDGLWPVGALLIAIGTFAGVAMVAWLTMALAITFGGSGQTGGAPFEGAGRLPSI